MEQSLARKWSRAKNTIGKVVVRSEAIGGSLLSCRLILLAIGSSHLRICETGNARHEHALYYLHCYTCNFVWYRLKASLATFTSNKKEKRRNKLVQPKNILLYHHNTVYWWNVTSESAVICLKNLWTGRNSSMSNTRNKADQCHTGSIQSLRPFKAASCNPVSGRGRITQRGETS